MKIPADAKIVRDERLTFLSILSLLAIEDGFADRLKADVKSALKAKGAEYGQSDFALGRLQGGGDKKAIDPKKFWAHVKSGKIKLADALKCISVKKKESLAFLSENEVDDISKKTGIAAPSLFAEFKDGISIDLVGVEAAILLEIRRQLSRQAA
jgi:hypothetical protein